MIYSHFKSEFKRFSGTRRYTSYWEKLLLPILFILGYANYFHFEKSQALTKLGGLGEFLPLLAFLPLIVYMFYYVSNAHNRKMEFLGIKKKGYHIDVAIIEKLFHLNSLPERHVHYFLDESKKRNIERQKKIAYISAVLLFCFEIFTNFLSYVVGEGLQSQLTLYAITAIAIFIVLMIYGLCISVLVYNYSFFSTHSKIQECLGAIKEFGFSTNSENLTAHPAPSTQHPAPSTQHPAPSTQHPAKIKVQINWKRYSK